MSDIPISTAKKISDDYGLDQVIIVARKTGDSGYEAVTTYGRNKEHCKVAANIGNFLKYKIMKWLENE